TTDLVAEIAAASTEQAQGIEQINTAVSQMDKVTQQNAAAAEESASAAEELSAQAQQMYSVVQDLVNMVGGKLSASASGTAQTGSTASMKRSDQIFHQIAEGKSRPGLKKDSAVSKTSGAEDDFKDFNG
ncbi:MAG TPA: hypothetical protein PLV55_13845, partial [Anaerohalosphaeraceae bacterium]|nr:hypothetical protein [Anaerohalosphaeraceae bacterium]